MRIDTHQHFWKYNPQRDAWIDESMTKIRKDFMPEDLNPHLLANNIDGCISVQANQSEDETEFLLSCAKKNDFIKGVIGWLDIRDPNLKNRLDHFSKNSKFKGLRHIVQAESDMNFMQRDDFQNGISCLKDYNLVYEILIQANQLPSAIQLGKDFPDQKFVLNHCSKPMIKSKIFEPWATHIKRLAEQKNVFCKISGLPTEADWNNWTEEDIKPYLSICVEAFGIPRVMFGSDWPVSLLACSYEKSVKLISNYIKELTISEQNKIMGENALQFYNLENIN